MNKPYYFGSFTLLELTVIAALFTAFAFNFMHPKAEQESISMAAAPAASTIESLSQIHVEIDALPIDPEVRQQMLLFIEVAEEKISEEDMAAAREAVLDFCRRIEWYRYQIGHTKINNLFNQAMGIAVELHNASIE